MKNRNAMHKQKVCLYLYRMSCVKINEPFKLNITKNVRNEAG